MGNLINNILLFLNLSQFLIFNFIFKRISINTSLVLIFSPNKTKLIGNLDYFTKEIPQIYQVKVIIADATIINKYFLGIKTSYYFNKARYIVVDDYSRFVAHYHKKDQKIVQLWHACGAFKKFGWSRNDQGKVNKLNGGHGNYDFVFSSSPQINNLLAQGFGVDIKNVYDCGICRTDLFFDKKKLTSLKNDFEKIYPQFLGKKIILFGPTYRNQKLGSLEAYDFSKIDLDKWYDFCKDEYILIFKFHPGINNAIPNEFKQKLELYKDKIIDLTKSYDINELLIVCDILITDYSSVIFEYSLLNKPIIFYAYDLEVYINERGLYYDFEDYVYGPICQNQDELLNNISHAKINQEQLTRFLDMFMISCQGESTKKTIEVVFKPYNSQ